MKKHFTLLLLNQRIAAVLMLGFSSGLPLFLSGSTLQAWFASSGISVATIGLLSLVGLPYLYKFLWAPLLDRYFPPFLTRRRGWIIVSQLAISACLLLLAQCDPHYSVFSMTVIALCLAFFSASQDISINAYQAETLLPLERGMGAAAGVLGYRVAMLIASGIALILADYLGWAMTYCIMASLMLFSAAATVFAPENRMVIQSPLTLHAVVFGPFKEFIGRPLAGWILAIIFLYKLGGDFVLGLNTTFFLTGLHFTLTEVGSVYKITGFIATIIGLFIGGYGLAKMGVYKSLFYFAVLQALASLLYLALAIIGKNYIFMVIAVFGEYCAEGMGTAALLAWLMSLCDTRYTATQFALFSAIASVGRVLSGPIAGLIVKNYGWVALYEVGFVAAFPALVLLFFKRNIERRS